MSEFEVTFKCKKCGKVLVDATFAQSDGLFSMDMPPTPLKCSCEDEPAYGPITVEMVAEMLCDSPPCSEWDDWGEDCPCEFTRDDLRAMARAVLRLLTMLWPTPHFELSERLGVDWHNKLMDIAKESK